MRRVFFIGSLAVALCVASVSVQASTFTSTASGIQISSPTPLLGQTSTSSGTNYSMLLNGTATETSLVAYADINRTSATGRLISTTFSDSYTMLTISGGSGTGSLGFRVDLTGHAGPGLGVGLPPDINTADLAVFGNPGVGFAVNTQGNEILTGSIPFTFDIPFQFRIYLLAHAELGAGSSNVFSQTTFSAVLAPFIVLDGTGAILSGASALSDAGYSYQMQAPVPEPASLLMLCTGLAGFAVARRVRRAKA